MILHLVNLTGFSGNTYFSPLPVHDIDFAIKSVFKPKRIVGMVNTDLIDFTWKDGVVKFTLKNLDEFEGIILER